MTTDEIDVLGTFQKTTCFAGVEPELVRELARLARVVHYRQGEVVTHLGQHFDHLAIMARGQIELSITNRAGKRHVLNVMQPGQIYGLIPMLDGKPLYYGATALTGCVMLMLPRELVIAGMHRSTAFMMGLFGVMCTRSRDTFSAMADQHLLSPSARLARYLVQLASTYGPDENQANGEFTVRFSQGDLSDMLGISRQSLNSAMKQLEQRKLVNLKYSTVRLTSLAALQQFVADEL